MCNGDLGFLPDDPFLQLHMQKVDVTLTSKTQTIY